MKICIIAMSKLKVRVVTLPGYCNRVFLCLANIVTRI